MTLDDLTEIEKAAKPVSLDDASQSATPETIMTAVQTRAIKQVKEFYKCILQYAHAICTTPHASTTKPYKSLIADADAVVLDEAGAMWKADALQVIGQTLRPVAMARDENQLPPTVMTLMDKDGSMLNQFAPDTRTSMLEHLKRTGQVCFVLN
ncbi:hypothetical protein NW767_008030 [Fusarium falciforme]|nr:hypothetical protein NW767_008030 [Fusarium falciforme]